MSRNGRMIIYEFIFENEQIAERAREALRYHLPNMLQFGMDKLVEEIEVEQQGEKIFQKFIFKSEKLADSYYTLMKAMLGGGEGT